MLSVPEAFQPHHMKVDAEKSELAFDAKYSSR